MDGILGIGALIAFVVAMLSPLVLPGHKLESNPDRGTGGPSGHRPEPVNCGERTLDLAPFDADGMEKTPILHDAPDCLYHSKFHRDAMTPKGTSHG